MTLKTYLTWMTIGTCISWGAFSLVITYLAPENAGMVGLIFFYLSLFLSVTGTLTLVGFVWRYFRYKKDILFRHVSISFRQGMLLAFLVVAAMFMNTNGLFTWWNMGLLIIGLTLLEFFWLSVKRPSSLSD